MMSDTNTKPITMSADEDEVIDVDQLMADFDKESNTRHFSGIFQKIIKAAMILFSLYVMFDGWTGTMEERQKMSLFIGIIVFIAFIIYPVRKKKEKNSLSQRIELIKKALENSLELFLLY